MACLAQFYPLKYPASFWLLVGCVSTYAVLSALMTYVAAVLERDGFAFTQPNPKKVCAQEAERSRAERQPVGCLPRPFASILQSLAGAVGQGVKNVAGSDLAGIPWGHCDQKKDSRSKAVLLKGQSVFHERCHS